MHYEVSRNQAVKKLLQGRASCSESGPVLLECSAIKSLSKRSNWIGYS